MVALINATRTMLCFPMTIEFNETMCLKSTTYYIEFNCGTYDTTSKELYLNLLLQEFYFIFINFYICKFFIETFSP